MIEKCVSYLKGLDRIVIPKEYTYFVHCAAYRPQTVAEQDKYNKAWTKLPLQDFIVNKELSCVERRDRVWSALQMGGLERAMTSYAKNKDSKPFQIRVIIPNRRLSDEEKIKLNVSEQYLQNLERTHSGLDNRHPKIMNKEHIIIFATSSFDEVTNTNEDIFYGIREQDLLKYTQIVSEVVQTNPNITMEHIPTDRDKYMEWESTTFSLPKNQNDYRYHDGIVLDKDDNPTAIKYSEFEQEYWNNISRSNENFTGGKQI